MRKEGMVGVDCCNEGIYCMVSLPFNHIINHMLLLLILSLYVVACMLLKFSLLRSLHYLLFHTFFFILFDSTDSTMILQLF
jgi:hypothetical protein